MKLFYSTLSLLLLLSLYSCEKNKETKTDPIDNEHTDTIPSSVKMKNIWVKDIMEEVYLWEDKIPSGLDPYKAANTFNFFDEFIYTPEDHWSFISDDYYDTEDNFNGINTTAGYEFHLTYMIDNYNVMGIIEYVLPNTPAAELGIKRGDVFTKIDGKKLNEDNYYDLITKQGSYKLTIDTFISYARTIEKRTVEISPIEDYHENPVFIDSIYHIEGKTIGYLMYNSFIDSYDSTDMKRAFSNFKNANITDLVLDLRYNLGGDGTAMSNLANLIAPNSALGEIFMREVWNSLYNEYWSNDKLITKIESNEYNINLTGKLIGLTTSSTASASEGVLNGLKPLTDLSLIGTPTHGKYTGMIVLPDNEDKPEWAIVPIVMKTTNKNGESVKGGMKPNIEIKDAPLDGYQLGDIRETMLSKAIEAITGVPVSKSAKTTTTNKERMIGRYKHNKPIQIHPILSDKKISRISH